MFKVIQIDHTADIGIEVSGDSMAEVFKGAIIGMGDLIVDTKTVAGPIEKVVTITNPENGSLLVDILTEMLFFLDVESFIISDVNIEYEPGKLVAHLKGDTLDLNKHDVGMEIKAVTYHMLEVSDNPPYARVLFDI